MISGIINNPLLIESLYGLIKDTVIMGSSTVSNDINLYTDVHNLIKLISYDININTENIEKIHKQLNNTVPTLFNISNNYAALNKLAVENKQSYLIYNWTKHIYNLYTDLDRFLYHIDFKELKYLSYCKEIDDIKQIKNNLFEILVQINRLNIGICNTELEKIGYNLYDFSNIDIPADTYDIKCPELILKEHGCIATIDSPEYLTAFTATSNAGPNGNNYVLHRGYGRITGQYIHSRSYSVKIDPYSYSNFIAKGNTIKHIIVTQNMATSFYLPSHSLNNLGNFLNENCSKFKPCINLVRQIF